MASSKNLKEALMLNAKKNRDDSDAIDLSKLKDTIPTIDVSDAFWDGNGRINVGENKKQFPLVELKKEAPGYEPAPNEAEAKGKPELSEKGIKAAGAAAVLGAGLAGASPTTGPLTEPITQPIGQGATQLIRNIVGPVHDIANTAGIPLHIAGKTVQNLASDKEKNEAYHMAGQGPVNEKLSLFDQKTLSPEQARLIGSELGNVATGEGKVGGVANLLSNLLGGAVRGVGKGVANVVTPVTSLVGDVAGAVGDVGKAVVGEDLLGSIKNALLGANATAGDSKVGGILGLAKDLVGQTAYGQYLIDPALRNLVGPNAGLYGNTSINGTGDANSILNAMTREASRISLIPLARRSAADTKFLESYPENRKTLLAADAQAKDVEAKELEAKQKKAGKFGSLVGGPQYNELAKITDYRTKMSKLISEEHRYHDIIAEEVNKGDKANKNKIADALERLKSAAGQNSALISQAAGQGAMSQSDKENLDRQNSQIVQIANDTISANALGTGAGLTSFYPIYTKLRGSLAGAMQGQINFLKSTRAPFEAAATLYNPEGDEFKNFSGDTIVEKNVPNYMTAEIDYTGTGTGAGDIEEAATKAELEQIRQAGKRTQEAARKYPNKLGVIADETNGGGSIFDAPPAPAPAAKPVLKPYSGSDPFIISAIEQAKKGDVGSRKYLQTHGINLKANGVK